MNSTQIKLLYCFLWIFLFTRVEGQAVTMREILCSKSENKWIQAQQNTLDYLSQKSFRLPFFDQISLRLNTEGLYYQPHSYQFRFRNNSVGMMRAQYKSSIVRKEIEQAEYDLINQSGYADRYYLLADLFFFERKEQLLNALGRVLQDKKNYFIKEVSIGTNTKVEDILEIDEDIFKNETEKLIVQEELKTAKNRLSDMMGKSIENVNFNDFISPENAEANVSEMIQSTDESILLRKRKMEIELNEWKRKSIIRSSYNLLNFWSLEYQDSLRKNDLLETRISFGLALNIPVPNSNKIKMQQAKLDVLEAEKKYEEEKIKVAKTLEGLKVKLKRDWSAAAIQKKQQEEFNKLYDVQKITEKVATNPYFLYKIRTIDLKKQLEIENSLSKYFKTYIELMDQLGILYKKNCLSANLEELK